MALIGLETEEVPLAWQAAFYHACRAAGFDDCPDHNHPEATGMGVAIHDNHDGVVVCLTAADHSGDVSTWGRPDS